MRIRPFWKDTWFELFRLAILIIVAVEGIFILPAVHDHHVGNGNRNLLCPSVRVTLNHESDPLLLKAYRKECLDGHVSSDP